MKAMGLISEITLVSLLLFQSSHGFSIMDRLKVPGRTLDTSRSKASTTIMPSISKNMLAHSSPLFCPPTVVKSELSQNLLTNKIRRLRHYFVTLVLAALTWRSATPAALASSAPRTNYVPAANLPSKSFLKSSSQVEAKSRFSRVTLNGVATTVLILSGAGVAVVKNNATSKRRNDDDEKDQGPEVAVEDVSNSESGKKIRPMKSPQQAVEEILDRVDAAQKQALLQEHSEERSSDTTDSERLTDKSAQEASAIGFEINPSSFDDASLGPMEIGGQLQVKVAFEKEQDKDEGVDDVAHPADDIEQSEVNSRRAAEREEAKARGLLTARLALETRMRAKATAAAAPNTTYKTEQSDVRAKKAAQRGEAAARGLLTARLTLEAKIRAIDADEAMAKTAHEKEHFERAAMAVAQKAEATSRGLLAARLRMEGEATAQITGKVAYGKAPVVENIEVQVIGELTTSESRQDAEVRAREIARKNEAFARRLLTNRFSMETRLRKAAAKSKEETLLAMDVKINDEIAVINEDFVTIKDPTPPYGSTNNAQESPLDFEPPIPSTFMKTEEGTSRNVVKSSASPDESAATCNTSSTEEASTESQQQPAEDRKESTATPHSNSSSSPSTMTSAIVPLNKKSIEFTSGLVGAVVGLAIGGPVAGAIAAAAANYMSRQQEDEGNLSGVVQSISTKTIEVYNYLVKLDDKYAMLERTQRSLEAALEEAKSNDNGDVKVVQKLEDALSNIATLMVGINKKYDLVNGGGIVLGGIGDLVEKTVTRVIHANDDYNLSDRAKLALKEATEKVKASLQD